jgi:hypothetical protein
VERVGAVDTLVCDAEHAWNMRKGDSSRRSRFAEFRDGRWAGQLPQVIRLGPLRFS